MATKKFIEQKVVETQRSVRVSDFSGVEIPPLRWDAITRIHCEVTDGSGNCRTVFAMDLMPEEMMAFRADLEDLIRRKKLSAKNRNQTNWKANGDE